MQRNQDNLIHNIFAALPAMRLFHSLDNPLFKLLHREIESYYRARGTSGRSLPLPFEKVAFPAVNFGNFSSEEYFIAPEEIVIRSLTWDEIRETLAFAEKLIYEDLQPGAPEEYRIMGYV